MFDMASVGKFDAASEYSLSSFISQEMGQEAP